MKYLQSGYGYVSVEFSNTCAYVTTLSRRPGQPSHHGVKHSKSKGDNIESVRKTFCRLKRIINSNYELPESVRFVTLTYAENMQDNKRLSKDLFRFMRRLRACVPPFEYIYVKEKQARGAWHIHMILFFNGCAPYLPNEDVRRMWGQGFVNVKAFNNDINNLGNYLSAYLTDDKATGKKGSRLVNYASNIRLYNCSKGIKRPVRVSFSGYLDRFKDEVVRRSLSPVLLETLDALENDFYSAPCLSCRESYIIEPEGKPIKMVAYIVNLAASLHKYMLCKPAAEPVKVRSEVYEEYY